MFGLNGLSLLFSADAVGVDGGSPRIALDRMVGTAGAGRKKESGKTVLWF